ncbi:MAG: hypothetical protein QXS79_03995 [Candidatus Bathyarchaeia archaeon]
MVSDLRWYYWAGIIIFVILGISTVIPAPASKVSLLGYYAHCSFAPISAIICFIIAGAMYWLGKKKEK